MAAPSVSTQLTVLHQMVTGSLVAPLREGAATAGNLTNNFENGIGFDTVSNITVLTGGRYEFSSSDFTPGQYATFQLAFRKYDKFRNMESLANGGMRILFEDSGGNWARFNLAGGDLETSPSVAGVLRTYSSIGVGAGQIFFIDRLATGDASSGTVDWSDIVAIEISVNTLISSSYDYYIGLLGYASKPIGTSGDAGNPLRLSTYNSTFSNLPNGYRSSKPFASPETGFMAATQVPYRCLQGVQIGNGSSATYFYDSNFELAFYASRSAFYAGDLRDDGYCVAVTDTDNTSRGLVINTPDSNCTCEFYVFSISGVDVGDGDYYIDNLSGSYLQMSEGAIWNTDYFNMRNTNASRVRFNNINSLNIDLSTVATGCQIGLLKAGSRGLVPVGGGGDYSNFVATIADSNTGNEITIPDLGSDASYDLSGLKTEGQTINIHYEGAANTVTVTLDPSISATWTSAGGTVVIDNEVTVTLSVNLPTGVTGVFVIHDLDSMNSDNLGTELQRNNTASGTQTFEYLSSKVDDLINIQFIAPTYTRYLQAYKLTANNSDFTIELTKQSNR